MLILVFFLCLLALFGIGLGPALWLLDAHHHGRLLALAAAPALALAIMDIIGFPLVVYVAPVRIWAWPVTLLLLAISMVLVWAHRRRWPSSSAGATLRRVWVWPLVYLATCLVLLSPLVFNPAEYAAFRSNASDAFFYMSLAETVRSVDWGALERAIPFKASNIANLNALAAAAPTALFTARFIARPTSVNHMTTLAWLAELAFAPVYRFYYPFHLLLLAAAFPAIGAIGRVLRLWRPLAMLAAAAVALGFWSRLVVEMDASYELGTVPILALLVLAWMHLEHDTGRWRWPAILLVALPAAGLVMVYYPVLIVFAVGLAALAVFHIARRDLGAWLPKYAAAGLLAGLIAVVTGQFLFHFRGLLVSQDVLAIQRGVVPTAVRILLADGPSALIGLPLNVILGDSSVAGSGLASLLFKLAGTLLVVAGLWSLVRRWKTWVQPEPRVLFGTVLGGIIVFAWMYLDGNSQAAGKAFTYSYPYLLLFLLFGVCALASTWSPGRSRAALALTSVWLVVAVVAGALLPYDALAGNRFRQGRSIKQAHDYDLGAIANALAHLPSGLVLVNVPRDDTWHFAYYVMQVLRPFNTYFQSGLVVDNSLEYRNFWPGSLTAAPDYVITLAASDRVGPEGMGELLASTPDLRLYRVTRPDLAYFQSQVAAAQQGDAALKDFPSWHE